MLKELARVPFEGYVRLAYITSSSVRHYIGCFRVVRFEHKTHQAVRDSYFKRQSPGQAVSSASGHDGDGQCPKLPPIVPPEQPLC